MDILLYINQVKNSIEFDDRYKFIISNIHDYLLTSYNLLKYSKEIEDGNYSKYDVLLETQIQELELRNKLDLSILNGDLIELLKLLPENNILKLVFIGFENFKGFNPNVIVNFSKNIINQLTKEGVLNTINNSISSLENIKYINDTKPETINALKSGLNVFQNLPENLRNNYLIDIIKQKGFTNNEDEEKLSKPALKYHDSIDMKTSENTKAWLLFFTKIAKEMGNDISYKDVIKEHMESLDFVTEGAVNEILDLSPKSVEELFSEMSNLDVWIFPDVINDAINSLAINNAHKLSNLIDNIDKLSPDQISEAIDDISTGIEQLLDGSIGIPLLSSSKLLINMMPKIILEKIPFIKEVIDLKENLSNKVKNGISGRTEELRTYLESKLGILIQTQDQLASGLGNQKAKSLINVFKRIGEEEEIFNRKKILSTKYNGKDNIKELLIYLNTSNELVIREEDLIYLTNIINNNITVNNEKLSIIINNIANDNTIIPLQEIDDKTENLYQVLKTLSHFNLQFKYDNKLENRLDREVFINYLLNQIDKTTLPEFKKNIYIESFIGKNNDEIKLGYSNDFLEDFNIKNKFLDQSLLDIDKRLLNNVDNPKLNEAKNSLLILKSIVEIEKHLDASVFLFAEFESFEDFKNKMLTKVSFENMNSKINNYLKDELKLKLNILEHSFNTNIPFIIKKQLITGKSLINERIESDKLQVMKANVDFSYQFEMKNSLVPEKVRSEFYKNPNILLNNKENNNPLGENLNYQGRDGLYLIHSNKFEDKNRVGEIAKIGSDAKPEYYKNIITSRESVQRLLYIKTKEDKKNLNPGEDALDKLERFKQENKKIFENIFADPIAQSKMLEVYGKHLKANQFAIIKDYCNNDILLKNTEKNILLNNVIDVYLDGLNQNNIEISEIDNTIKKLIAISDYDRFNIIDTEIENSVYYQENNVFILNTLKEQFNEYDQEAYDIMINNQKTQDIDYNEKKELFKEFTKEDLLIINQSLVMKEYFKEYFQKAELDQYQQCFYNIVINNNQEILKYFLNQNDNEVIEDMINGL